MKSNYKSIGELVVKVDNKNTDGTVDTLLGVSIDKCFIKSVANTIGTDLTKYKIIKKNEFAVSLMQVSRDSKIPIACLKEYDVAIMSPAYSIFKVIDENIILPDYLALWFQRSEFDREAAFIAVGGVRGSMPWEEFCRIKVLLPSYDEQLEIVDNYKAITDRIALKKQINDNLEAQVEAIFNEIIVEKDLYPFNEPLDKNIDFINGLAMQNFRPEEGEKSYPVIKIRELSQGFCDSNSEYCNTDIGESHTITKGDLVFSWSGSLQSAFWTSETCGLNQHLFKVTSHKYPKWLVYLWVKYHLLNFQRIAENKGTTFGHIKREDLHNAQIKSLDTDTIKTFDKTFSPIIDSIIANSSELHYLMELERIILSQLSR